MLRLLRTAASPVDLNFIWSTTSPASVVAHIAKSKLGVVPGSRCLVLHSLEATLVASQLGQALRRGGFFPVLSPLPIDVLTEQAALNAVANLNRTGSMFVVACGGAGVIDAAKAAAALATGPGGPLAHIEDAARGYRAMAVPSLPLILVPAGHGGTAAVPSIEVLRTSHAWLTLLPAAPLLQVCILSPGVLTTLPDPTSAIVATEALAHCVEAVCAPGIRPPFSRLLALQGAARAASAIFSTAQHAADPAAGTVAAANSLIASVIGGLSASQAPLGATRGLARALCAQYYVPYATAVSALLPGVVRYTCNGLSDSLTASEDADEFENVEDASLSRPQPVGVDLHASPAEEDMELPELLPACTAILSTAAQVPWMADVGSDASVGSCASVGTTIRRSGLLACILAAVRDPQNVTHRPRLPTHMDDPSAWTSICEALPAEVDALAAAAVLRIPSLLSLPASLGAGGVDALRSVAEVAEVDVNTLRNSVPFSRSQLLQILQGVRISRRT